MTISQFDRSQSAYFILICHYRPIVRFPTRTRKKNRLDAKAKLFYANTFYLIRKIHKIRTLCRKSFNCLNFHMVLALDAKNNKFQQITLNALRSIN